MGIQRLRGYPNYRHHQDDYLLHGLGRLTWTRAPRLWRAGTAASRVGPQDRASTHDRAATLDATKPARAATVHTGGDPTRRGGRGDGSARRGDGSAPPRGVSRGRSGGVRADAGVAASIQRYGVHAECSAGSAWNTTTRLSATGAEDPPWSASTAATPWRPFAARASERRHLSIAARHH
jgi:hypothetical protein